MEINKSAPIVATGEIEVAAYPEIVWDVMAGIDRWPAWNPDVKSAHLEGEMALGSKFRWKAGPGMVTSTIQQVARPRTLAWTGNTLGINAIHVWRLEPKGDKPATKQIAKQEARQESDVAILLPIADMVEAKLVLTELKKGG